MKIYSVFCIVVLCIIFVQVIAEPVPKSSKALKEENPSVEANDVIDAVEHSSKTDDVEDGEDIVDMDEEADREIEDEHLDDEELEPSTKSYYGGKCKKLVCERKYDCDYKKCGYYYKTVKCSGGGKGRYHYSSHYYGSHSGGHHYGSHGYCKKKYYKTCKKCYYKRHCYYKYGHCGSKYKYYH